MSLFYLVIKVSSYYICIIFKFVIDMSLLDSETNSRIITSSINGEDLLEKRMPLEFFIEEQTRALDYFLEQSSQIYEYEIEYLVKQPHCLELDLSMMLISLLLQEANNYKNNLIETLKSSKLIVF